VKNQLTKGRTLPKSEHTTLSTTLTATQIKSILSSVLSGADIESLNQGPLDDDAAIAILASQQGGVFKKSPFGSGNAVAQVIVEDRGSARHVELITFKDTMGDSFNRTRSSNGMVSAMAAGNKAPNIKAGRQMVEAILHVLREADPSIRPTK
jgi:hypothetical protein